MMMFSDDPLLDFDRYDRQQAEELAKLPSATAAASRSKTNTAMRSTAI